MAQPKMKKDDRADGQMLLGHCRNTVEFMSKPVNVTITSASDNINGQPEYILSAMASNGITSGRIRMAVERIRITMTTTMKMFIPMDEETTLESGKADCWRINGKEHDAT